MNHKKYYTVTGTVMGWLWGGGLGMMPAKITHEPIQLSKYDTVNGFELREDITAVVTELLKNGSLTKTGDFNGLKGVILNIEEWYYIVQDDRAYRIIESEPFMEFIGDLTEDEQQQLFNTHFNE